MPRPGRATGISLAISLALTMTSGSGRASGDEAGIAAALRTISESADVALLVDPDIALAQLAPLHGLRPATVEAFNRQLAGTGLVAIRIDDQTWRIAADPLPTYTLPTYLRRGANDAVDPPWDAVWRPAEETMEPTASVADVTRMAANFYGAGSRLYIRGIPRTRWLGGIEDVAVTISDLPLPDFVLDATDVSAYAYTVELERGAGHSQRGAAMPYAGGLNLDPVRGGRDVLTRFASDGGRSAHARIDWGGALDATGYAAASVRREPLPALTGNAGAARQDVNQALAGWRGEVGAWRWSSDAFAIEGEAGPRLWDVTLASADTLAATPQWEHADVSTWGVRQSVARHDWAGGDWRIDLGYLRGRGRFDAASASDVSRWDDGAREYRDLVVHFDRNWGRQGAGGVSAGLASSRDGRARAATMALEASPGFSGDDPALKASEASWFGRRTGAASDTDRQFVTGWLQSTIGPFEWSASLRAQTARGTRADQSDPVWLGATGCTVEVLDSIDYFGQWLEQGETLSCEAAARAQVASYGYLHQGTYDGDVRVTGDVALGWRPTASSALSLRAYNRHRPGGVIPADDILAADRILPEEDLWAIELAGQWANAISWHQVTLFANQLRPSESRFGDEQLTVSPWSTIYGAEYEAGWTPTAWQSLSLSLGYLHGRPAGAIDGVDPSVGYGSPAWSGSAAYQIDSASGLRWQARLSFADVAQRDLQSPWLSERTSFTRLDLGVDREWGDLRIGLVLNNVTDRDYLETTYEPLGATRSGVRSAAGRTLLLHASYAY